MSSFSRKSYNKIYETARIANHIQHTIKPDKSEFRIRIQEGEVSFDFSGWCKQSLESAISSKRQAANSMAGKLKTEYRGTRDERKVVVSSVTSSSPSSFVF